MGYQFFTELITELIIDGGTLTYPDITVYGLKYLTTKVDANTAKIGTLPTEYATVGAALTAMDAKIDARELPSTSADGQYALSAKKKSVIQLPIHGSGWT